MKGLSLRTSYGINRLFALEGEIIGATSGNARFSDTMFQGREGELARNSSLGRVQIGGVARLGYKYTPTLRLGIGFQGVSNGTRFVTINGDEMDGPDTDFEVDVLLSASVGFDIRLGDHWRAGLSLSGLGVAKSTTAASVGLSLEGGLHIGYGWTPGGVSQARPSGQR